MLRWIQKGRNSLLAQVEKRKLDEQQSKDIEDMKKEIAELTKLVKKLVDK